MRRLWIEACAAIFALLAMALAATAEDDRGGIPIKADQSAVLRDIAGQLGENRSFALVIGIADFKKWPKLRGVLPEADMIAKALADQGFQVERGDVDGTLTKADLRERIARFLHDRGGAAENRLVIYIATHGYAAKDRRDLGFLAASDTAIPGNASFEESAYSVKELSAALTGVTAQHIYLFFNACFSGALVPDPTRDAGPQQIDKPELLKALSPEVAKWTKDLLSHNARLVLTAGSDSQTVPDTNNPYARAVAAGLSGEADADGDGLVLGTELAQFVRGRVARETRLGKKPNDAVFAVLPKVIAPAEPRADAPERVDYALQGDFVFLSPKGPRDLAKEGHDEVAEILAARAKRLPAGQFVECVDCPVMVRMPGGAIALSRDEITLDEWDACYQEFGCRRYLPDDGRGRGERPASGLTWQDVMEYTLWLDAKKTEGCGTYRLPTADEWRAAAGYGTEGLADIAETGRVNCDGCGVADAGEAPVVAGTLPADALGLRNLYGNLWEWVSDGPECGFGELREQGRCPGDGTVMGGSYATSASSFLPGLEGHLPRTSNETPWSWQTVGLRVACDMRKPS